MWLIRYNFPRADSLRVISPSPNQRASVEQFCAGQIAPIGAELALIPAYS